MISLIACIGKNRELGKAGDLCWRFKEDMRFFKTTTLGHKVVMGFNTFKSLGYKPLPGRENFVIARPPFEYAGVSYTPSDMLIPHIYKWHLLDEEVFIIGGAKIYEQAIQFADRIYLTEVNRTCPEADVFFPNFDETDYDKKLLSKPSDELSIYLYERKTDGK